MKIAIVTATFPPYHGGTGNVCLAHAQQLIALGHEVQVWTARRGDEPQTEQRGQLTIQRLRPLLRLGNGFFLPQLVWRLRGFDIIHWHYPFFGGECVAFAAKLTRTPLIVTYHQDVILDGWLGKVAGLIERSLGVWALNSAEKILFTSHDYAQHSKMRPHLKATLDALPNGVDLAHFSFVPTNNHGAEMCVLLVAGLDQAHYFKGVSNFLQALAQLKNIQGVIVGDGELRPHYEQIARDFDIAQRVQFTGRVSASELPHYYQEADVTVLPSTTMGEAFGLVLVESMACGTPVIASDLPGVRTVINDGIDGFLVRPNDVNELVEKLKLMQEQARNDMGKAGREKVERLYGWVGIGRKLAYIYQNIKGAEE